MKERSRPVLLSLLVGALSLTVTALAWQHERDARQRHLRAIFEYSLRETTSRIAERTAAFEQMLRSVQGLFKAVSPVSEVAFQTYVDSLLSGPDAVGLQVFGYAPLAPDAGKSAPLSAPVAYVAPASGLNLKAVGYDQLDEPNRRAAMLQARDTGYPAITHRVVSWVDRGINDKVSFVLFMPLYQPGAAVDSVRARDDHLTGWVFTTLRIGDLMSTLYGEDIPGIVVRIYDGIADAPDALIYDSAAGRSSVAPARFQASEYLNMFGNTWMVTVATAPEFAERFGPDLAKAIGLAGLGFSLLMAMLTWQLASGRARARALAGEMTAELRESEAKLRHLAGLDPLTMLPNRSLFSDRMQSALSLARRHHGRVGVMFVDLDRFKPINDTYGHGVGDRLLVACAARMRDCVRESDTLARIGGDEFVVMLTEMAGHADADAVADKIRHALTEPFEVDGHVLTISVSVGIAVFPDDGADELNLMKHADQAMYRAKFAKRGETVSE
jgi:diguanylate cyclase (GGDEF)-like protein